MIHPDLGLLAIVGSASLAGLVLGGWLGARAERQRGRTRLRARFRAGRVAESEAVRTLEGQGFEVLDAQVEGLAHVYVGGERVECAVRADYLVRRRRDDSLGLVEVKSGAAERLPQENDTRRQLLEYWLVFDGLPLYHLDAATHALVEVGFAYGAPRGAGLSWVLVGALVLGALAFLAGLVVVMR